MEKPSKSVLVGVDGSEPARIALSVAIDYSKRYGARLLIVAICALPSMPYLRGIPAYPQTITHFPDFSPKVPKDIESNMSSLLKEYERDAEKAGVIAVESKIIPVWNTIGWGLVKEAETQHCSIVIIGSRGLTGIKRTLLGSVADYVVKNAPCDVLIIRG